MIPLLELTSQRYQAPPAVGPQPRCRLSLAATNPLHAHRRRESRWPRQRRRCDNRERQLSARVDNPHWALGDFDYNGFVDDDDVTLLGVFYDPTAELSPGRCTWIDTDSVFTHLCASVGAKASDRPVPAEKERPQPWEAVK